MRIMRRCPTSATRRHAMHVNIGILFALLLLPGMTSAAGAREEAISLDGNDWHIAADPRNVGQQEGWQNERLPDAKPATVPKIAQFMLPGCHGVLWYWRDLLLPERPEPHGRYLLRFQAVFYKADVYVNGQYVGGHEGGETPFTLDVTDAVRPGQKNLVAVRVLDPLPDERIDGIVLREVPHRTYGGKYIPTPGGIIDSVELVVAPAVYVSDLYVRPDWKTGQVQIDATVVNTLDNAVPGSLELAISLDGDPVRLDQAVATSELAAGMTHVQSALTVADWRLWDLDSPTLYRVTTRLTTPATGRWPDLSSVRCGFRDFRFGDGYLRLNGKRVYVRSGHTANHAPVGIYVPYDHGANPDLIQRGMLEAKRLGFNMVRFIGSIPRKNVVDYCDEIGLLLYVESMVSFGGFNLAPKTAETKERFDRSIREMIVRDRNNPSVVIWGLLNEVPHGTSGFHYALDSLPMVREYDPTRVVMFSSGRWDNHLGIASASNPGAIEWDVYLGDEHPGGNIGDRNGMGDQHRYPTVPHSPDSIAWLRNVGQGLRSRVFLKEYGVSSGQHLPDILALHERHGGQQMEMYQWFADMNGQFMADWEAWKLHELYPTPSDFFDASQAAMARQRLIGINAVRANPCLLGHNVTSLLDVPTSGEGVLDSQRHPKPGMTEVMQEVWAPLRLCLFTEPYSLYRKRNVQLEAVLANEDVLGPGRYQVALTIADDTGNVVWKRTVSCVVPEGEPPFAIPFFSEQVRADWPSGKYRFRAELAGRPDAAGGEAMVYVADSADMPRVDARVTLWGQDDELHEWLSTAGIETVPYSCDAPAGRELILVGRDRPVDSTEDAFLELARRVARGSAVVFLTHLPWTSPVAQGSNQRIMLWPPLIQEPKTSVRSVRMSIYLADHWGKDHPVFAGMPAAGMLDRVYYREITGPWCLSGAQAPAEAIAGAIDTSAVFGGGYSSGLTLAAYDLGGGRFFINTLNIRDNLGKVPSAERLLRNLLNYAGRDLSMPLSDLPPNVDRMLRERVLTLRELELPPADATLMEEEFDPPSASGWKTAGGSWQAGEGQYRQTDDRGRAVAYFAGGHDWTDYIASAEVPAGAFPDRENAGLCFRVSNDGQDAYVLRFLDTGHMSAGLIRRGRWYEVGSYPFTSVSGKMYTLTVAARGSNFGLFVDGVRIGGYRDDTLKQGTVGLYTYRKAAAFGPVKVAAIQKPQVNDSDKP